MNQNGLFELRQTGHKDKKKTKSLKMGRIDPIITYRN